MLEMSKEITITFHAKLTNHISPKTAPKKPQGVKDRGGGLGADLTKIIDLMIIVWLP